MAKKIKVRKQIKKSYPERSREVPATQAMLYEVRDELIERIDSVKHELKSEFTGLKSEFHGLRSDVHGIKAEVHRIALLVEEQNARNAIVLDGLTSLFARQDRVEADVRELRETTGRAR